MDHSVDQVFCNEVDSFFGIMLQNSKTGSVLKSLLQHSLRLDVLVNVCMLVFQSLSSGPV
jgi:hypothetical protein